MRNKSLGGDTLPWYIIMIKFRRSNTFAMITSLSKHGLQCRRFILLLQAKAISLSYRSSTGRGKPQIWMRLNLIFLKKDIYINSSLDSVSKVGSSSKSTENKNIPSRDHLLKDHGNDPNQHNNNQILSNGKVYLPLSLWKVNENRDNNMITIPEYKENN